MERLPILFLLFPFPRLTTTTRSTSCALENSRSDDGNGYGVVAVTESRGVALRPLQQIATVL